MTSFSFDITFDGRRNGMALMRKRIKKLSDKQLPKFKKKVLKETGMRAKKYIISNIDAKIPSFKGSLRRSVQRRTMKDRISISVLHGGASALEEGYGPHYIHRNMLTGGGYKVGDWMDAKGISKKRNYILVGKGPTAKGAHFVRDAVFRINREFSQIVKQNLKEFKR